MASPHIVQSVTANVASSAASISGTLTTAPAAGNTLVAIIGTLATNPVQPASGWTCAGIASAANNGGAATNATFVTVLEHPVVSGDGTAYSFPLPSGGSNNYVCGLWLAEVAGAVNVLASMAGGWAPGNPSTTVGAPLVLADSDDVLLIEAMMGWTPQATTSFTTSSSATPSSGWSAVTLVGNASNYGELGVATQQLTGKGPWQAAMSCAVQNGQNINCAIATVVLTAKNTSGAGIRQSISTAATNASSVTAVLPVAPGSGNLLLCGAFSLQQSSFVGSDYPALPSGWTTDATKNPNNGTNGLWYTAGHHTVATNEANSYTFTASTTRSNTSYNVGVTIVEVYGASLLTTESGSGAFSGNTAPAPGAAFQPPYAAIGVGIGAAFTNSGFGSWSADSTSAPAANWTTGNNAVVSNYGGSGSIVGWATGGTSTLAKLACTDANGSNAFGATTMAVLVPAATDRASGQWGGSNWGSRNYAAPTPASAATIAATITVQASLGATPTTTTPIAATVTVQASVGTTSTLTTFGTAAVTVQASVGATVPTTTGAAAITVQASISALGTSRTNIRAQYLVDNATANATRTKISSQYLVDNMVDASIITVQASVGLPIFGSVAITAQASVGTSATIGLFGSASITAQASVGTSPTVTQLDTASVGAQASVSTSPTIGQFETATINVQASAAPTAVTAAIIAAQASLGVSPTITYFQAVAVSAKASVNTTGTVTVLGGAAITATASVSAAGIAVVPGAASVSAQASVSTTSLVTQFGAVAISAQASITQTIPGAVGITSAVSVGATTLVQWYATAHIAATASVMVRAKYATITAAASLATSGSLTLFGVPTITAVGGVSFVRGYVPPPVFPPLAPVQYVKVTDRFLQELAAPDQTRIVSVEVWKGNSPVAILTGATMGEVDVDVTQQIRRTCSITVQSQGVEYDDWIPTNANSPLHPASGNELRIFRGYRYSDGTQELFPLGVFRMTKPVVADTGDAITINITGNDRSALVSARKWTDVYPIQAGTNLGVAIQALIQNRIPDLNIKYRFGPTYGLTVPATTYGLDLAGSNDPFADAMQLGVNAGRELFFDVNGDLVLQDVPDPSKVDPSFLSPAIYSEGENATFLGTSRSLDETKTYNGVIVIGTGTGGPPVRAEVWDTDPSSPTYYKGTWGKQPYIYSTTLVPAPGASAAAAYSQVLKTAQTLFTQVRTLLDTPSFQCVPNPALIESHVVLLQRARIGLNAAYGIAQMTIPLDVSSLETVTCRGRNLSFSPDNKPAFALGAHGG